MQSLFSLLFKYSLLGNRNIFCFWGMLVASLIFLGCTPQSKQNLNQKNELTNLNDQNSKDSSTHLNENKKIVSRELLNQHDRRISYCETDINNPNYYSSFGDDVPLPLASLSKLFTSSWALNQLGANYRFKTEYYLKPINSENKIYDMYLKTNYDPIFDSYKVLFLISELNRNHVQGIRHLIIDESTKVFLSALKNPHLELDSIPVSSSFSISELNLLMNSKNWNSKTIQLIQKLNAWGISNSKNLKIPQQFSVESIHFVSSNELDLNTYTFKNSFNSAPLSKYLKNLNTYSNNYLADYLFWYMGGASKFVNFQLQTLHIQNQDLKLFTGSGLPWQPNSSLVRQDNWGTCHSVISGLKFLYETSRKQNLNLGSILLNPTRDLNGTFSQNIKLKNAAVLKTGRLFEKPALNLAGFFAGKKEMISFVFLGHDFNETETAEIENQRNKMLENLFLYFGPSEKAEDLFNTIGEFDILL